MNDLISDNYVSHPSDGQLWMNDRHSAWKWYAYAQAWHIHILSVSIIRIIGIFWEFVSVFVSKLRAIEYSYSYRYPYFTKIFNLYIEKNWFDTDFYPWRTLLTKKRSFSCKRWSISATIHRCHATKLHCNAVSHIWSTDATYLYPYSNWIISIFPENVISGHFLGRSLDFLKFS